MNLAYCRIYFSHRDHREHREGISVYFLNLCASVSSVRYDLFAPPLYIEQLFLGTYAIITDEFLKR